MSESVERVSRWFYRGVWGILTRWFCVPAEPPSLPTFAGSSVRAFQPADGFLRYLKFQFWIVLTLLDLALASFWIIVTIAEPWLGIVLTPVFVFVVVVPNVLSYLALHLRYDTMWYVISERSMRIRRGIWIIRDTTITFENVQNVTVNQGPLQRIFGIADVLVQTAGGGGMAHGKQNGAMASSHHGLIEGIENATEIRDLILSRLKKSRTAGLGDEEHHVPAKSLWTATHLQYLREIRTAAQRLSQTAD